MRILGNLFKVEVKCSKCKNPIVITEFHGNFLQGDKLTVEGGALNSADFVKGLIFIQCNKCHSLLKLRIGVNLAVKVEKSFDIASMGKCPQCGQLRPITMRDLDALTKRDLTMGG